MDPPLTEVPCIKPQSRGVQDGSVEFGLQRAVHTSTAWSSPSTKGRARALSNETLMSPGKSYEEGALARSWKKQCMRSFDEFATSLGASPSMCLGGATEATCQPSSSMPRQSPKAEIQVHRPRLASEGPKLPVEPQPSPFDARSCVSHHAARLGLPPARNTADLTG